MSLMNAAKQLVAPASAKAVAPGAPDAFAVLMQAAMTGDSAPSAEPPGDGAAQAIAPPTDGAPGDADAATSVSPSLTDGLPADLLAMLQYPPAQTAQEQIQPEQNPQVPGPQPGAPSVSVEVPPVVSPDPPRNAAAAKTELPLQSGGPQAPDSAAAGPPLPAAAPTPSLPDTVAAAAPAPSQPDAVPAPSEIPLAVPPASPPDSGPAQPLPYPLSALAPGPSANTAALSASAEPQTGNAATASDAPQRDKADVDGKTKPAPADEPKPDAIMAAMVPWPAPIQAQVPRIAAPPAAPASASPQRTESAGSVQAGQSSLQSAPAAPPGAFVPAGQLQPMPQTQASPAPATQDIAPGTAMQGSALTDDKRSVQTGDTAAPSAPAQLPAAPPPLAVSLPPAVVIPLAAPVSVPNAVPAQLGVTAAQHDLDAPATLDSLGIAIAAKSTNGLRHFDIRLDPPELGHIQVHLSVDGGGKAQAALVVDRPQTLELLQRDAGNLNRTLTDAGLILSNNGLNFSLRGEDRQNDRGRLDQGRSRALTVKAVVGTDAISTSASIASLAPDSARLDIRV